MAVRARTQEAQTLSLREWDGAKRQGEGRRAETFINPALTQPSATLSQKGEGFGL
jgi:hypothetical protein